MLALPLTGAVSPPPPPVAYTLSPEMKDGALSDLKIEIRFHADRSGTTELAWARRWAGEHKLWQWARDLTVDGAERVQDEGQGRWRIQAAPGAPITVRYRVLSAYDHDPAADDGDRVTPRPVIRPTWFYAAGETLFAIPEGHEKDPATFAWTGAPAGFGFASDLEHLAGPDRPALRPGTVEDVLESISIGGRDLHVWGSRSGPSRIRVATLGQFAFRPEALDALVPRIIATERSFWRDGDAEPFLVTAIPLQSRKPESSYTGTGRGDAFALWIDASVPLHDIVWVLGHEYFHTWNPARIGGFGPNQAEAPSSYWLSEGFTDYYARALLVRSGLITPEDFAAQWNSMLLAYAASPVRRESNARVIADFWKDDAVNKLPYQRGALLAAIWNARLRAQSRGRTSLDDLMRAQEAAARADGPEAARLFPTIARRFGLDAASDIARHVDRGEPIRLPPDTFGPCARVVDETRPVYDRGFDVDATVRAGMVVTGVDRASPAYAAGLRDGMKILERVEGEAGDSLEPYALRISDHGVERVIRYLPQGKDRLQVQQMKLARVLAPGCAASLGGGA